MKRLATLFVVLSMLLTGVVFGACHDSQPLTSGTDASSPGALDASTQFKPRATPGQVGPFVIPTSWRYSAIAIDPQNASGCASDNNRTCNISGCTSSGSSSCCATSGDGPCITYGSVATRWGTYYPRLQQPTIISYLSAPSSGGINDPIYAYPSPEQTNTYLGIQCAMGSAQQTGTGTITVVSAKTRTEGASSLLTVTYPSGTAAANIAVNSSKSSRAWVFQSAGGNFTTTQPFVPVSPPTQFINTPQYTEVDSWATGNTVTTYAPITIYMPAFKPSPFTYNSAGTPTFRSGFVYNCNLGGAGDTNTIEINSFVSVFESSVSSLLNVANTSGYQSLGQLILENSLFNSLNTPPGYRDITSVIVGGAIQQGGSINAPTIGGDAILSQTLETTDFILGVSSFVTGGTDGVYLGSGAFLLVNSGNSGLHPSTSPIFWGPGTLDLVGPSRFTYVGGAGAATPTFANSTIELNSETSGACVSLLADAAAPTCNQTISNTNLDTLLGANPGCVGMFGGASFCNYGQ